MQTDACFSEVIILVNLLSGSVVQRLHVLLIKKRIVIRLLHVAVKLFYLDLLKTVRRIINIFCF